MASARSLGEKNTPGAGYLGGTGARVGRAGGAEGWSWEYPSRRRQFWDDDRGDASLERAVSRGAEADDDASNERQPAPWTAGAILRGIGDTAARAGGRSPLGGHWRQG